MAPTVFITMGNYQAVSFCGLLKATVVVGPASAAILYAVHTVEVMAHFMKQRGAHVLDGSGQRASADVDFVGLAVFGNPAIVPQGEVAVSLRRGLDGDGWP